MIKRTTKMVSLLIAGVSVLSLVPTAAYASDVKKLDAKDGNFSNVVVYNGSYAYEGYKDDAESTLYFSKGTSTDKIVQFDDDELDSDIGSRFGSKNVILDDSDDYLLDLSTGKVTDEDTADSLKDDAVTKLKKEQKKVDRFENTTLDENLVQVTSNRFVSDVYYLYKNTSTDGSVYFGFTNKDGKYIDVSNDLNATYFNGTDTKKIKEYKDSDYKAVLKDVKPIAQDSKFIYAIATVEIPTAFNLDGTAAPTQYFLQKISKDQGEKEDDAYLPSSTTSYLLAKDGDSDAKKAYDLVMSGTMGTNTFLNVVDGKFVVTSASGDTVTVSTLNTKNTKLTVSTLSKDFNIPTVTVSEDDDIEDVDNFTFDVNGNTWLIKAGKIFESAKGADFEQIYRTDGSLDKIDVYDSKNLVAWENDGESYAAIVNGKEDATDVVDSGKTTPVTTPTTTPTTAPVPATLTKGWTLKDGSWLYSADGITYAKSSWVNDKGAWYYLNANGTMATGWVNDKGTWYYLNGNGSMATGWLNDNGTWYYLNGNGSMAANTTVDGYTLNASGAWVK